MRRRRFWWRNPDPEEDLLDLQLPPDEGLDLDAELLSLGADVPPSVDEELHLELPPEDYEIDVDFERPLVAETPRKRGRPRKVGPTEAPISMTRDAAERLLSRRRGPGRPPADLAAKLAAARRILGEESVAPMGAPTLWGPECVCKTDKRGIMTFSSDCPTHEFLANAVAKHKSQKKAASKAKKAKPVKSNRKPAKLTKTEALKIVAQSAGKRGKRNKDFRAALKVLCKGAKRRRSRRRRLHRRGR